MDSKDLTFRNTIARSLQLVGAHIIPEHVFRSFSADQRGQIPERFSYSAFQLLEHMRLALADQFEYCTNQDYTENLKWPDDYWPQNPIPEAKQWEDTVEGYRQLIDRFTDLALKADLTKPVPKAVKDDHTILRGILLMSDHNAYHLGQIVSVGKALGVQFPKV